MSQRPIYTPKRHLTSNLDDFREHLNRKYDQHLSSYEHLHEFSTTRLNDFWMTTWEYLEIKASVHPSKAISDDARIDEFPMFFEEARLNFAENILCGADDAIAVLDMNELNQSSPDRYTRKQLRQLVAQHAGVLRRLGMKKGDVVVVIGGNCVRSLAILLAAASIGAIFAGFATDMGEKSLIDRVVQLQPKVLIAELCYQYNGKMNDITTKLKRCLNAVGEEAGTSAIASRFEHLPSSWQNLSSLLGNETDSDLKFDQLPFNTPFIVLFSSGTTGTPKGIVHGQGNLLINGFKEHYLHNNFGPEDVHFHHSGIGWTLWNISLGAMFCQTAMLLYDGSPFYPTCDKFLQSIFAAGVTAYGGSPRYFSELRNRDVKPKAYLNKVHTILSTGALLTPGTAAWMADAFGPLCQIGFSGGTELCGNFATGTVTLPCYAGEIQVKELGMDVDAFDQDGKSVPDGEAGELVCKKPFPNMPVAFWNDPNKERYFKSYFTGYNGVWTHGDLIRVNPATKGIYVLGRSDGVLNPSGIRFGTSDLYNVLSGSDLSSIVVDSLAVGQQRVTKEYSDDAERVILFLKLTPDSSSQGLTPPPSVLRKIRDRITSDLSKRHVPHFFFEVSEIPHNANGKKMEIQVKQICNAGISKFKEMKLTPEEQSALQNFVKFYEIEKISKETARVQSKL